MTEAERERAAILEWLRNESRQNHRTAFKCWQTSRMSGDIAEGSIGDSIFHEHQVKDRIIEAIERGDHHKDTDNGRD